tara:strand:- start:5150 stop:5932 length:783 start_codon:yes stop_codon:yes gene_type:complete
MNWMGAAASLIGGWYANKQAKKAQGVAGEQADWAYGESRPRDYTGLFGGYTEGTGEYLNEDWQARMQDFMDRSQATAGQIGDFSPEEMAQQQYEMDLAIHDPEFQEQQLNMESRLLSQGRLGQTGGIDQFGRLMEAQGRTKLGMRKDAWAKSQQMKDIMRAREMEDLAKAMQIGSMPGQYGMMSMNLAKLRGANAWNAAQMKSGAAANRAGANSLFAYNAAKNFGNQQYGAQGSGLWNTKTFSPTTTMPSYGAGSSYRPF